MAIVSMSFQEFLQQANSLLLLEHTIVKLNKIELEHRYRLLVVILSLTLVSTKVGIKRAIAPREIVTMDFRCARADSQQNAC